MSIIKTTWLVTKLLEIVDQQIQWLVYVSRNYRIAGFYAATNNCKIKLKQHLILRATVFAILNYSHKKQKVAITILQRSLQCSYVVLNYKTIHG